MNSPFRIRPTVVDLFSGCGGLSLGFEQAGFEIRQAYDIWPSAIATYQANFKHPICHESIGPDTLLPEADVLIGGPPCQGFSSAGPRRVNDHRNSLVGVFARLVAVMRPQAFVFENVEGFLTGGEGSYLFELLGSVLAAGYHVHLRKVNAAAFGIPQHRKRVIAIGGLGWAPRFPEYTHRPRGAPGASLGSTSVLPPTPSFLEALAGLPTAKPIVTARSCAGVPDHSFTPFGDGDRRRAEALLPGQRMRDLPEDLWHRNYHQRANRRVRDGTPTEKRGGAPAGLRRLRGDEPSKAITGAALRDFVHPIEDRPLTIRECARLQTFPDSFQFCGSRAEQVQQIGNAVPVRLAAVIAENLLEDLCATKPIGGPGRLLSFIPTLSSGMSPILKRVTEEVETRYGTIEAQFKQRDIKWD